MSFQCTKELGLKLEPVGQSSKFLVLVAFEGGHWIPLTPVELAQEGYVFNGHYVLGVMGHYPSADFKPNQKMAEKFYAVRLDRTSSHGPYSGRPLRVWIRKNSRWVEDAFNEVMGIDTKTEEFLGS